MSDNKDNEDFFPGFIEDEKAPQPPARPGEAIREEQGFNPFAEEQGPPPALVPDPALPPPLSTAPAVAQDQEQGFNPFAGEQSEEDEPDDAELKPGSRKDLWVCPHCGAGNRPGRDTCRTCGKSPDDPVVPPWFRRPPVMIAMAAGIVCLLLLLWAMSGPSFALSPARHANINNDFRHDTRSGGWLTIDGEQFHQQGRFAAVARVIRSTQDAQGRLNILVAFGAQARNPNQQIVERGGEVGVPNALGGISSVPFARLTIVDDRGLLQGLSIRQNDIISLTGHYGSFDDEEQQSQIGNRRFYLLLTGWRQNG